MAAVNISTDYSLSLADKPAAARAPNPHTVGYHDDGKIITMELRKFVDGMEEYSQYLVDDARLHITLTVDGMPVADFLTDGTGFPEQVDSLRWKFSNSQNGGSEQCKRLMQAFYNADGGPVEIYGTDTDKTTIGIFYPLVDVAPL